MKPKLLIFILFITWVSSGINAQNETATGFSALTKKGSWSFGMNYRSFALSWFITENKSIIHSGLNPFISHYICDKISINLSYVGIKTYVSSRPEYSHSYNNAELGLSYLLAKNIRLNLSFEAGYFFGQYRPYRDPDSWWKKQPGSMAYAGVNLNWSLKKFSQFALQASYRQYFNLNKGNKEYIPTFNTLSFGLIYFYRHDIGKKKFL